MLQADYHMHTMFSTDSKASPSAMVEAAIARGLSYCCITDHMDYCYPSSKPENLQTGLREFEFLPDDYFDTLLQCREAYKNQITLCIGVELGLRNEPDKKEEIRSFYQKLLSDYPFDFCIGSTHVLDGFDPYEPDFWNNRTAEEGLKANFASIAENANYYEGFQVYGHLDYIIRYLPDGKRTYLPADYQDFIDLGLKRLIEKGIGIECNTSGYRHGLSGPHPQTELLKRYRELGGELLTIGSDAHCPEQVAQDFYAAEALLLELGFRYYTVFQKKKPEFLPLGR